MRSGVVTVLGSLALFLATREGLIEHLAAIYVVGFMGVMFVLSNILWIAWGWHDSAWALIALQTGLLATNVRGIMKNEK